MENNCCASQNPNDPINQYIKDHRIDIEDVPIDILRQSISLYNQRVENDYVYGVKLVSKDYKHMFGIETTPPYEVGKTYHYDEGVLKDSKFDWFCYTHKEGTHTAGLWASPCIEKSIEICEYQTLNVPILVRFPLQTTIILGNSDIKGKVMEVVSIDRKDVEQYLK